MLINLKTLQCIYLSKVVVFYFPDKPAVQNSLHSLAECQFLSGLLFVKDKKKSRLNLLSRGSHFYEMIGAAEYRNQIFAAERPKGASSNIIRI